MKLQKLLNIVQSLSTSIKRKTRLLVDSNSRIKKYSSVAIITSCYFRHRFLCPDSVRWIHTGLSLISQCISLSSFVQIKELFYKGNSPNCWTHFTLGYRLYRHFIQSTEIITNVQFFSWIILYLIYHCLIQLNYKIMNVC